MRLQTGGVIDRTIQLRLAHLARAFPKDQENKTWGFMGPRDEIYRLLALQYGLKIWQVRAYFESEKKSI